MTPDERAEMIKDGVERAHSFHSAGHWEASTDDLMRGWAAAELKLNAATTQDLVFLASVSRELNAQVLRHRGIEGPWNA